MSKSHQSIISYLCLSDPTALILTYFVFGNKKIRSNISKASGGLAQLFYSKILLDNVIQMSTKTENLMFLNLFSSSIVRCFFSITDPSYYKTCKQLKLLTQSVEP